KSNVLGIGKKKYDAHADQWWARALDSSLKGLDVSKDKVTGETGTVTAGAWGVLDTWKAGGGKWVSNGGLYGAFVKGEGLRGTLMIEDEKSVAALAISKKRSKKKTEGNSNVRIIPAENHRGTNEGDTATLSRADCRQTEATASSPFDPTGLALAKDERRWARRKRKLVQATNNVHIDLSQKEVEVSATSMTPRKQTRKDYTQQVLRSDQGREDPPSRSASETKKVMSGVVEDLMPLSIAKVAQKKLRKEARRAQKAR
ncbi:hypothetical protein MMC06_006326, partial [Schaereria dolodes]|nr:hypothetical protein [Schaereria dolodes]